MIRSESGTELLRKASLSVPFHIIDFEIGGGVGGGFVVVNHYGDYGLSAARVNVGVLGIDWVDIDSALTYLHRTASLTSTKCATTGLSLGGAGILLYFKTKEDVTDVNRKKLLTALVGQLKRFDKTNILCLPANLTTEDLEHMYQTNEMYNFRLSEAEHLDSQEDYMFGDEKHNSDSDSQSNSSNTEEDGMNFVPFRRTRKKGSFAIATESFDYPIPKALIGKEAANTATKSAAHSSFGSIVTLNKAKKWENPRILLLGVTPLSVELYHLLARETSTVVLSDPDDSIQKLDDKKINIIPEIPATAFSPWQTAKNPSIDWDIIVFCSPDCPKLERNTVSAIRSKAVVSVSDDFLPHDYAHREDVLLTLDKTKIFEVADGMSDLGEIAKVYSLAAGGKNNSLSFHDAFELGCKVMQKKLHLHGIVNSDDVVAKRRFHDLMEQQNAEKDETAGLLGLGAIMHQSSDQMTAWLWNRVKSTCPAYRALASQQHKPDKVRYLDMGAGNGAAARWITKQSKKIHFTCIDVCAKQSAENRNLSDEEGLGSQIDVVQGTYERLNSDYSNFFDGCMSQDAFIHAFAKKHAFSEAFRVTKGGGWLLISDLMRGDGKDGNEEMDAFVKEHNITNWATPNECVKLAEDAGWSEVRFIDCTAEINVSLHGLLKKIKAMMESGNYGGRNLQLLKMHRTRLSKKIGQADRGIFKWGIISGRKPYDVVFMSEPPVAPEPRNMINYSVNELDGDLRYGTDVLVVNIGEKLDRSKIMALPSTVRLIVTLSAGLDHICVEAANERGIRIRRAARFAIVKSVADYLLSNVIFGLRNGFQNVGVPFPGKSWDLTWNSDGVDLDCSKIGFIGMGAIAIETAKRIRALSKNCELVYHVPSDIRCRFEEGTHQMYHVGIADLVSTCDVIIPMVPLTESTTGLINYSSFSMMKRTAIFINMARGKVVETAGMLRALEEGLVRHAILDTTDPEPLPPDHNLWSLKNCTITPHFATNTTYVRKELVEDIPNQVEDTLEERGILRLEEERMRFELSDAYRITREFGMDELVWNHISVLLSDGSFLITPGSLMFDDIGPEDLVKSSGNVTADIIHEAVYKTRSDVRAIVHLHTPATVAVSCLEMGFVPLAQEAAPFIGRVSRHPWHGVSNDREEQALIGESIKDPKVNTLLMENHGFCTFGRTLGEAWVLAYYFDKACQTQLSCLQTGQKINFPSEKVLAHAAEQSVLPEFLPGACEWGALRKMLSRKSRFRR